MKRLFEIPAEDILSHLKGQDRDTLLYKIFPHYFMELANQYFRVEVVGGENLPKRGRGLITPNHSGVSGFDAMVLNHEVHRATRRYPRLLMHHLWFTSKLTATPAKKLGMVEATTENGLKALKKNQMVVLFPEGEWGNFKPSSKAYQLQEFKRGFIRMALETNAPIIPTLVLGAEESHVNLARLKLGFLGKIVLPLPLNMIPLPSKWKIIFMKPILLPYKKEMVADSELMREIAEDIRDKMQDRLNKELKKRR